MKTIVGVDLGGLYRPALNLVARLGFPDQHLHLHHAGERVPVMMALTPGMNELPVAQIEEADREAGQALLERASREAAELGLEAEASYEVGNPAHSLISLADGENADLIAVGAAQKGKYGSFVLGSVGRGLVIGAHQSVLVAKGDVASSGSVKVVFATDHSEYAQRCLDRLLSLRPQGIESITVVTATESEHPEDLARRYGLIHGEGYSERRFHEALERRCSHTADQFAQHGYRADYKLLKGHPHETIRGAMREGHADLLILGAQGHGFMERLLIGSFSLQQVVAEQHSALIVRL